jgi:F-type H+-transporting ATPase subunit b
MIDINWTVLIQIANFLFLLFVLNIVLYKPIRGIIGQRKAKVQGLESNISTVGRSIEEKDQAVADSLRQARIEGQSRKEAIVQAAQEEEKAIIDRINAKAQEDLAAVKAKIAADTNSVRKALEKEVNAFADAITDKILGRAAR